jgi:predicted methyltransferase
MSRARVSITLLCLAVTACDKSSPSVPPSVDDTAAASAEQSPEPEPEPEPDPEAKARAELANQLAERLAAAEKQAAERKARWTPELEEKVAALSSKKFASTKAALKAILASEHRAPGHAERDAHRRPAETLAFFGLEPNMKVFEVAHGAGWYTEILAPLLARDGKLYLAGYDAESSDARQQFSAKYTELFITSHGNLYEKVELVTQGGPETPPNFGPEGALDMVLVFRMLHNFHRANLWDRHLPAIHAALKPGGVLAVVQHRAAPDADPDASAATGYMPEPWVIEKIESYGFKLQKKSEINANPKDTKDHEQGVWTLPPTLALGDTDKDKYLGIGESDRSTLKFVKAAK